MVPFNPSDFTKLYETYEEHTGERLTEKRLAPGFLDNMLVFTRAEAE